MTKKQLLCILLAITFCSVVVAQNESTGRNVSFDVKGGYSPTYLLNDNTIQDVFAAAGANLSFSVFFLHEDFGNMGVQLGTNWTIAKTEQGLETLTTHIIPLHTNFVYQYHFNDRLALNSHVGVGINIYNLQFLEDEEKPGLLEIGVSTTIGTALQISITNGFYTEVGVGYIVSFPKDVVLHQIIPSVSFGYRF